MHHVFVMPLIVVTLTSLHPPHTFITCTSCCPRDLGIHFPLSCSSHLFYFSTCEIIRFPLQLINSHTSSPLSILNNSFLYLSWVSIYTLYTYPLSHSPPPFYWRQTLEQTPHFVITVNGWCICPCFWSRIEPIDRSITAAFDLLHYSLPKFEIHHKLFLNIFIIFIFL